MKKKKEKKYQNFLSENFPFFLVVKFSINLNRRVCVLFCRDDMKTVRSPSDRDVYWRIRV